MQRKQITLRLPVELHEALEKLSDETTIPVKNLILLAILNSSGRFLKLNK